MVRSNQEYCASVWSPHTEKLKSKLEQVQRRATGARGTEILLKINL
jgi:hypothetical protein